MVRIEDNVQSLNSVSFTESGPGQMAPTSLFPTRPGLCGPALPTVPPLAPPPASCPRRGPRARHVGRSLLGVITADHGAHRHRRLGGQTVLSDPSAPVTHSVASGAMASVSLSAHVSS